MILFPAVSRYFNLKTDWYVHNMVTGVPVLFTKLIIGVFSIMSEFKYKQMAWGDKKKLALAMEAMME